MSETAFMKAAAADLAKAQNQSLHVPELDMTVWWDVPTAGAIRRVMRECQKDDDLKASALIVRNHARDEHGAPIVPRDDDGLRFLLENVRPTVLGRLAKAIAGQDGDELGKP